MKKKNEKNLNFFVKIFSESFGTEIFRKKNFEQNWNKSISKNSFSKLFWTKYIRKTFIQKKLLKKFFRKKWKRIEKICEKHSKKNSKKISFEKKSLQKIFFSKNFYVCIKNLYCNIFENHHKLINGSWDMIIFEPTLNGYNSGVSY